MSFNKFKTQLINYKYVEQENINTIPLGTYIKYISKNNLILKGGFLKNIKENEILELFLVNKKKWFIYTDKYYIFFKIPNHNKLKNSLLDLVNNNFTVVKNN